MQQEIIHLIDNPHQLEKLYRDQKSAFKNAFNQVYPQLRENPAAQVWYERLNFEGEEISWGPKKELLFILCASCLAAVIAKLPWLTGVRESFFYPRNLSFVFLPALAAFFAWKQKVPLIKKAILACVFFLSAVYINLLPDNKGSDTLMLACMHLPVFAWTLLGYAYAGGTLNDSERRLGFLRYNGELVVMCAVMAIAGGILTGMTIGLFSLIQLDIKNFYFDFVVACGAAVVPVIATWMIRNNPHLVNKVSPVIARIFTPVVLVTLVIYLGAVVTSGKNPYNDREFLLVFNALLAGVMAIVFFSVAETSRKASSRLHGIMLVALACVTIIINSIALSAILYRIASFGITPNRMAVLGSNILMLANLVRVTFTLFRSLKMTETRDEVGRSLVAFLPLYAAWAALVTFIFPLIFHFQ